LPVLYLRGVSTGDFQEALAALLGKAAPNLSPAVISRLTADGSDYVPGRPATSRPAIRIRVGGRGLFAGPDGPALNCMLVLIGATPEGKKELVGFQTGVRESAQSWRELLIDIKLRGSRSRPTWRSATARSAFGRPSRRSSGRRHQRVGFTRPPTC